MGVKLGLEVCNKYAVKILETGKGVEIVNGIELEIPTQNTAGEFIIVIGGQSGIVIGV